MFLFTVVLDGATKLVQALQGKKGKEELSSLSQDTVKKVQLSSIPKVSDGLSVG